MANNAITFFENKDRNKTEEEKDQLFLSKLPNVNINSCSNCSEALWRHNSKKGPTCFCTVSNEYTFIWEDDTLSEQVLDCSRSQLYKDKSDVKEDNDTAE